MAMKRYSAFLETLVFLETHNHLMSYTGQLLGKFYPSAEKQSVYFAAPTDWAKLPGSSIGLFRTPHSPKLQHYRNLTIRLFSVIFLTLVMGRGFTPLKKCCRGILQPQQTGQRDFNK